MASPLNVAPHNPHISNGRLYLHTSHQKDQLEMPQPHIILTLSQEGRLLCTVPSPVPGATPNTQLVPFQELDAAKALSWLHHILNSAKMAQSDLDLYLGNEASPTLTQAERWRKRAEAKAIAQATRDITRGAGGKLDEATAAKRHAYNNRLAPGTTTARYASPTGSVIVRKLKSRAKPVPEILTLADIDL